MILDIMGHVTSKPGFTWGVHGILDVFLHVDGCFVLGTSRVFLGNDLYIYIYIYVGFFQRPSENKSFSWQILIHISICWIGWIGWICWQVWPDYDIWHTYSFICLRYFNTSLTPVWLLLFRHQKICHDTPHDIPHDDMWHSLVICYIAIEHGHGNGEFSH